MDGWRVSVPGYLKAPGLTHFSRKLFFLNNTEFCTSVLTSGDSHSGCLQKSIHLGNVTEEKQMEYPSNCDGKKI